MSSCFYVTLYSDKGDEQATIGSFNTLLHKPIVGSFEVALVEISFPISWKVNLGSVRLQNIGTGENEYVLNFNNYDYSQLGEICNYITYKFSQIPDTIFITPQQFRPKIRYTPLDNSIKLSIDEKITIFEDKIAIATIESDKRLKIDQLFANNFRFKYNDEQSSALYSHFNKPILKTIPHLYVYCDIIANQFDGNSKCKLLRVVPVQGQAIDTINYSFTDPHYCTVNKTCINSIEMSIKDHFWRNIHFESGRVIFKLHFRKK